jgi:hypothetical protein
MNVFFCCLHHHSKVPTELGDFRRAFFQSRSCRRLVNIARAHRPFAYCGLRFFLCHIIHQIAMEEAVFAIHFIPRFVVFAFADRGPFRFEKAIAHDAPFRPSDRAAISPVPAGWTFRSFLCE